MKSKVKDIILLTLIYFGLLGFFSILISNNENIVISYSDNIFNPRTSEISSKIHIKNNWTAAKAADICTGDGTSSNPYIISDLEINAGSSGSCILIEDSNVYFKVINCTLNGSGSELTDAGLKLINVEKAQILNNTFSGNENGIYMEFCVNCLIVNNSFINNLDLKLMSSTDALIYLNSFKGGTLDFFIYNSTFNCKSPQIFIYKYNETTHYNYLGNYWSGYTGDDNNYDGIGDTANIYYNSHVLHVDYYPLIRPIEFYEILGTSEIDVYPIPGYELLIFLGIILITSLIIIPRKLSFQK